MGKKHVNLGQVYILQIERERGATEETVLGFEFRIDFSYAL